LRRLISIGYASAHGRHCCALLVADVVRLPLVAAAVRWLLVVAAVRWSLIVAFVRWLRLVAAMFSCWSVLLCVRSGGRSGG